jgi:hypothetical protein
MNPEALTAPVVLGVCLLGGIAFTALMLAAMHLADMAKAWIDGNTPETTLYGAAAELESLRWRTEWEARRLRELKEEIARREEEDREGEQ